jgi:hypothetical protein
MESRLNCYNFIFGTCKLSDRCPYGHVIVKDKESYMRSLNINDSDIASRTSPRAKYNSGMSKQGASIFKSSCNVHESLHSLDDFDCIKCKRIKKYGDLYNVF